MSIFLAIIVLGVLVIVHELGHFLVAKWCNVYVERFSIGFGPKLYGKKHGETEYMVSLLPLGGYVKMYGENDDKDNEASDNKYDFDNIPKEGRSFQDKTPIQKALIILAGPLFNIIFAVLLFWGLYTAGVTTYSATVGEVEASSPAAIAGLVKGDKIVKVDRQEIKAWGDFEAYIEASAGKDILITLSDGRVLEAKVAERTVKNVFNEDEKVGYIGAGLFLPAIIGTLASDMPADKAGLKSGDKIEAINGVKIEEWREAAEYIRSRPGEELTLTIKRAEEELQFNLTPTPSTDNNVEVGLIGIGPFAGDTKVRYNLAVALKKGLEKSYELSKLIYVSFLKLIQRVIPADSLGGPILIVQTVAKSAESGIMTLLIFVAAISLNLAIFNLLPIPMLDGGQLIIIAAEAIMGRRLGEKALQAFQMVGFAIIIGLMLFAFYNDIMRFIR